MSGNAKSLLISNMYFPPQAGGISHFMGSIASALGRDHTCCLTSVSSRDADRDDVGIRVYRRPAAFAKKKPVQLIGLAAALSQILLVERPQVVQLAMSYEGSIALLLHRWFRLPFVIYAHGNEVLDAASGSYEAPRRALLEAARVFAISQFTAKLVAEVGVDPARIVIVNPGCDSERFRPRPANPAARERIIGHRPKDRIILTVGLESLKGHDMVIRALPKLLETVPDVTYLIVGAGPQERLDGMARELGVRDCVVFTGLVSSEQLLETYAMCDVFAMPSRQNLGAHSVEGFGLVFLEASACGKPVIGGRSGGVSDAVVDGVTGLLADPLDPAEIASVLARLLTDAEFARKMGEQGRARVLDKFTWATVGGRVQAILDEIVRGDPVRSHAPAEARRHKGRSR